MPVMEPDLDRGTLKAWAQLVDGGAFSSLPWSRDGSSFHAGMPSVAFVRLNCQKSPRWVVHGVRPRVSGSDSPISDASVSFLSTATRGDAPRRLSHQAVGL